MIKAKNQRGYLLVTAAILIATVGVVGCLLAYMFAGSGNTSANAWRSRSAFYIAASGMEVAKRDVIANDVGCTAINGAAKYTAVSFGGGQYTITGAVNSAATTLSSAITSTATTIALASVTNFAASGIAIIEQEKVYYPSISGTSLSNVKRGINGTTAAAHSSGVNVRQRQCSLTAVGGVPTIASVPGQGSMLQGLFGTGFSLTGLSSSWPTYVTPTLIGLGTVTLSNNTFIINGLSLTTLPNFSGSTIIAGSTVTFNNNAATEIGNGSGGLVVSSRSGVWGGDAMRNQSSVITSSNLFPEVFGASKATVQAMANTSYNSSNINGVTGATAPLIWVSGNLTLTASTVTIGSAVYPVILIVNGNASFSRTNTIYGYVYVIGTITSSSTGTLNVYGGMAAESTVILRGTTNVTYDANILALTQSLNSGLSITNYVIPSSTQAVLP
jgi:hypothetical protein